MAGGTSKSDELICTGMNTRQAVLGEMAGSIAHEVNNPLAALQLCLENLEVTIQRNEAANPDLVGPVKQALRMVERISRIVKGLRALSLNEARDPLEKFKVGDLIEETLEVCEKRLSVQSIRLELKFQEDLILNCRKVQVSQILMNLLNNACDALSAVPHQNRWIQIEAVEKGDWVEIAVMDGGPGPVGECRKKLFQPFYTTKGPDEGTGLGLHLSRSLAEDHGGSLVFDAGASSCRFVLTLPSLLDQPDSVKDGAA